MKPLTIQQIRQAVGGKPLTSIPPKVAEITAVCTDTRRMEPGSLFIALSGENFDGHEFLPDAAKGGAIAAIIEEPRSHDLPNLHLIGVKSTRQALGKLATYVRKQMRSKVIAVAGSNGKTSTKYLIDAALAGKLKGSISPKSFNNDIGVPLAIFPADPMQDYLVLEMGTNHPGEIKVLTDMAQPDIAVITSIGAEHLEFLGDLMGVRRENASIISGLNPRGTLVYNGDDAELESAVAPYPGKKIKFGFRLDVKNDLFATHVETLDNGVRFNLNNSKRSVFVPMLGRHTASNALAAIAVARSLRLSEEEIIQNLSVAHGPEMRLQRSDVAGITVLNDAYNANPHSMKAALETLAALKPKHRRVAILGDMRELGEASERYHKEIGEFAAACKLDLLVCVGKQATLIAESAERSAMAVGSICRFSDAQEAAKGVLKILRQGDLVLLKASRGMRLERVAEAIAHSETKFFRKAAS